MLDPDLGGAAVEVVGAEVVVHGAVLQHMIDRRQDRGGHGGDCLLRAAPAAELMELGSVGSCPSCAWPPRRTGRAWSWARERFCAGARTGACRCSRSGRGTDRPKRR